MNQDPNKRVTKAFAREWAEFQEAEHRRRLWAGVRAAVGLGIVLAMAVGMMLYLSSRLS